MMRLADPPMVWIKRELVGAKLGSDITMSCESDANPKPMHHWHRNGTKLINSKAH